MSRRRSITSNPVWRRIPTMLCSTRVWPMRGASGSGTWVATQLLSFQPYGCGVIFGDPLPPNLCGGKVMLRVLLTDSTSGQQFEGVLWVFCQIGNPPPSAEEGARLDIIGVNNFNRTISGMNVYVKTS